MVPNSSIQRVAWEMFSQSKIESFISILLHAKCVNDRYSKLDGINVSKYADPWQPNIIPAIAKMKGKVYATKIFPFLLMTRLACDQVRAYFLCNNYVPVFYHKLWLYYWQIQHFSKSGGWFSPLCHCRETQLQLEQLERLRCEHTPQPQHPPPHDYPYYRFILDHKSKQHKIKVTILKNLPKVINFLILEKKYTWHIWSCW